MRVPGRALSTSSLVALLLASALLATGCRDLPSSATIRYEIERQIPEAQFERDSHVHLGRVALALLRPVVRWALDEDDEARVIVSAIKRVDVATYRVVSLPETVDRSTLARLEKRMTAHGWQQMVRDSEDGLGTWVFAHHGEDGSIRGLLVVELDREELAIVGVQGRLDEVLAAAIADEPGEFSQLFGS